MNRKLSERLFTEGLISEGSFQKIKDKTANPLFSLYWEIKTMMYLGVLLVCSGLGILVYKNIDSIGHSVIVLFLGLLTVGCYFYCYNHGKPFSVNKVNSPNTLFDYLLLLACLSFLTLIAYLQYQYVLFGNRYGLAGFLPMLILFISAYYFDNTGILSLGITNLAAWLGITVTPLEILKQNDFNSAAIILTGILLAVMLVVTGLFSKKKNFKEHFQFTYTNFGMHIFFICCIAAMIHFESVYLLWFLLLAGFSFYFYKRALTERSFYFLVVTVLYAYFASGYVAVHLLSMIQLGGLFPVYLGIIYFIISGIGMAIFLMKMNKTIRTNDSI